MKHLSQAQKRRIQRRAATIKGIGIIAAIFSVGFLIGHVTANAEEPMQEQAVCLVQIDETKSDLMREKIEMIRPVNLGQFKATAYCSCEKCCGIWSKYNLTASGAVPEEGVTVAVDPKVIPLGSTVYVEFCDGRVGEYIAQDTGSAIKGNKIDVYFESHEEAWNFGVQKVNVKVLEAKNEED